MRLTVNKRDEVEDILLNEEAFKKFEPIVSALFQAFPPNTPLLFAINEVDGSLIVFFRGLPVNIGREERAYIYSIQGLYPGHFLKMPLYEWMTLYDLYNSRIFVNFTYDMHHDTFYPIVSIPEDLINIDNLFYVLVELTDTFWTILQKISIEKNWFAKREEFEEFQRFLRAYRPLQMGVIESAHFLEILRDETYEKVPILFFNVGGVLVSRFPISIVIGLIVPYLAI